MSMTARQVYEGVLTEMNKVQAPSMLLEDFNYFINKAVNQYINKKYNVYDVNQQSTDDLRVLKATMVLKVAKTNKYGAPNEHGDVISRNAMFGATYEAYLPEDYLHMLNCICNYKVKKQFKCYDPNTYVQFGATRLTADLWGQIINNFYMKPSYKRPYYYLHNVNPVQPTGSGDAQDVASYDHVPTNPFTPSAAAQVNTTTPATPSDVNFAGTDMGTTDYHVYASQADAYSASAAANGHVVGEGGEKPEGYPMNNAPANSVSNLPRVFTFSDGRKGSLVEKMTAQRIANPSQVRIEIRTGKDDSIFELQTIYIDYIKAPQHIRLTQEQIDLTEDTSQMMEFPDYVCQEIINELTHLIMENSSDPRLQSHMPITMSIANPAQAADASSSK
jgi:hypothetical protein